MAQSPSFRFYRVPRERSTRDCGWKFVGVQPEERYNQPQTVAQNLAIGLLDEGGPSDLHGEVIRTM